MLNNIFIISLGCFLANWWDFSQELEGIFFYFLFFFNKNTLQPPGTFNYLSICSSLSFFTWKTFCMFRVHVGVWWIINQHSTNFTRTSFSDKISYYTHVRNSLAMPETRWLINNDLDIILRCSWARVINCDQRPGSWLNPLCE